MKPSENTIPIIGTKAEELENRGSFRTVAIQSNDIQRSLDVMIQKGIKNISINSEWGWSDSKQKLDFIKSNNWIEGVAIVDDNIEVDVLNELKFLKRLQLPDKVKGVIDFNNFINLQVCAYKWNSKQFLNFGSLKEIEYLNVSSFNQDDLMAIKDFNKLKELHVLYSSVASLQGIEKLPLDRLFLWHLSKLLDIDPLKNLKKFKELQIYGCKKIKSYIAIKYLTGLTKLQIVDSASLPSTEILNDLKNIKIGRIGVEILDHNTKLLDERGISYKKYKSYNKEAKDAL